MAVGFPYRFEGQQLPVPVSTGAYPLSPILQLSLLPADPLTTVLLLELALLSRCCCSRCAGAAAGACWPGALLDAALALPVAALSPVAGELVPVSNRAGIVSCERLRRRRRVQHPALSGAVPGGGFGGATGVGDDPLHVDAPPCHGRTFALADIALDVVTRPAQSWRGICLPPIIGGLVSSGILAIHDATMRCRCACAPARRYRSRSPAVARRIGARPFMALDVRSAPTPPICAGAPPGPAKTPPPGELDGIRWSGGGEASFCRLFSIPSLPT